ncbi:hypothetical protein D770_04780 [Flammeovirgaceae bacterium 311]|nr:hypothetical protein D770_04780 [Flammeovirgaceae bacterium 311]
MIGCYRYQKLVFLLPLLLVHKGYSQGFTDRHKDVFERVEQINAVQDNDTIALEYQEELWQITEGGGVLVGSYKEGNLVKMVLRSYLSSGINTFSYYFSDGELFFVNEVFDQFHHNEKTNWYDPSNTERNFNGNYIFQNEKLIDLETLGHNRFEDDALDPETELLNEAIQLKELLESKMK